MARKTSSNPTSRSKKTVISDPSAPVQNALEVSKAAKPAKVSVNATDKAAGKVPINIDIEEQIRVRAYELYLERRATAGSANGSGNESQDWLIAEQEILSRHNGPDHHA